MFEKFCIFPIRIWWRKRSLYILLVWCDCTLKEILYQKRVIQTIHLYPSKLIIVKYLRTRVILQGYQSILWMSQCVKDILMRNFNVETLVNAWWCNIQTHTHVYIYNYIYIYTEKSFHIRNWTFNLLVIWIQNKLTHFLNT